MAGHDDALATLMVAADQATAKAYAPYSRFRVGAAVMTRSGRRFVGVNVENAATNLGVCAERAAIVAAVVAEGPEVEVAAVAVAARGPDGAVAPAPPCGGCRQWIFEFGPTALVAFRDAAGDVRQVSIAELLPHGFRL